MSILRDLFAKAWNYLAPERSRDEVLADMAAAYEAKHRVKLDYVNSVVDRMKLLGIDEGSTTFAVRKQAAAYYGITDYSGSAEDNARLMDAVTDDLLGR
jgi:ABC-type proline/glycine betaine transport system substrate-binding protein